MPVYNAEETLSEALESLADQTFNNFEIIAVDDGSTDTSLNILQTWAGHENRLKISPNIPYRHSWGIEYGVTNLPGASGRPDGRRRPVASRTPDAAERSF